MSVGLAAWGGSGLGLVLLPHALVLTPQGQPWGLSRERLPRPCWWCGDGDLRSCLLPWEAAWVGRAAEGFFTDLYTKDCVLTECSGEMKCVDV